MKIKSDTQMQLGPVTAHFRNVTKKVSFLSNIILLDLIKKKKKRKVAFSSSKQGCIVPRVTYGMMSLQIHFWVHREV